MTVAIHSIGLLVPHDGICKGCCCLLLAGVVMKGAAADMAVAGMVGIAAENAHAHHAASRLR